MDFSPLGLHEVKTLLSEVRQEVLDERTSEQPGKASTSSHPKRPSARSDTESQNMTTRIGDPDMFRVGDKVEIFDLSASSLSASSADALTRGAQVLQQSE